MQLNILIALFLNQRFCISTEYNISENNEVGSKKDVIDVVTEQLLIDNNTSKEMDYSIDEQVENDKEKVEEIIIETEDTEEQKTEFDFEREEPNDEEVDFKASIASKPINFFDNALSKYPNKEYLEFRPLKGNNLLASFNFEANSTTELYPHDTEIGQYNVFPKSLGSILQLTKARELHLRFGHGWYDAELNGKLTQNGEVSGGTGVELWATIEAANKEEAFYEWIKLSNYLSGMFCASFNFIESSITTYPVRLFQSNPKLLENVALKDGLYVFRSALPREPVCTENLTPFLKLLPTKGKAGIASLLAGNKIFNAEWSSMAVDVVTDCVDSMHCQYSMKQSINLVLNVPKILERNEMPIPKPTPGYDLRCDSNKKMDLYNCFPLPDSNEYHYGLLDLFGRNIKGGSLIASEPSKVCFDVDLDNWEVQLLSLAPIDSYFEDNKLCFDLTSNADYDINLNTHDSAKIHELETPPICASRSLSGYSQDSGGFRIDVYNPGDTDLNIVIFETLPWFVRLYLHSLTLSATNDLTFENKVLQVNDPQMPDFIKEIIYNPAVDRIEPSHLELLVCLPAKTKLKLSLDFDKAMLLYAEYPPDANHGFELEPAVIAIVEEFTGEIQYIMRTTTSLFTLPTPDFSMPYNVIILTSTVMSLAFGAIFNLLIKRTVTEEESDKLVANSKIEKLKQKIGCIKKLIRGGIKSKTLEE